MPPYSSLGAAEAAKAVEAAAASLHHLVIKSFINLRLFLGKVFAKNARGNSVVVSNNSSSISYLSFSYSIVKDSNADLTVGN